MSGKTQSDTMDSDLNLDPNEGASTRLLAATMSSSPEAEVDSETTAMTVLKPEVTITVKRKLYSHDDIEREYVDRTVEPTLKERLKDSCTCTPAQVLKTFLGYFPVINVIRNYALKRDVIDDVISGLSVSFLQMPQGLALALLATVPAVYGLYSTFFPCLLYVVFGTSAHVSAGTNAVLSLLTAGIISREMEGLVTATSMGGEKITPTSESTPSVQMTTDLTANAMAMSSMSEEEVVAFKVGVASSVAFVSGLFLIGMGLLKLGFITSYMSPPFIRGFTTAAAFHIGTSQVPKLLRISVPPFRGAGKIVRTYIEIFSKLGDSNPADVIVSAISFLFLLGVTIWVNERYKAKLRVPVPVQLIIVVVSTLISHLASLHHNFGLAVVGDIPLGFPAPALPNTEVMSRIVVDSFVIAILIFTLTVTLAKLMADTHNYTIDTNQELIGYGMMNFVSSFFLCIASATAPPRTMILSATRAKTTLNGIITSLFIMLIILVAGQLFYSLPVAVLAAMIISAMKNLLLQVRQLPELWRVSKPDFWIWLITCVVSIFGDLDLGIAAGVGLSIFSVIVRNQLSSGSTGGFSDKEDLILFGSDRDGLTAAKNQEFVVFRFPSQLFFANADRFMKELYSKALSPLESGDGQSYKNGDVPNDEKENNSKDRDVEINHNMTAVDNKKVKYVILECSAMTYIDIAGANTLKKVQSQYQKIGVTLLLVKCPPYTLDLLERAGYFQNVDRSTVLFDIHDAIASIRQSSA